MNDQHEQEPTSVEHTSVSSTTAASLTESVFSGALDHDPNDVNDLKSNSTKGFCCPGNDVVNINNDTINSGNEAITIMGEIVGAYQLERDDVGLSNGVDDEDIHPYAQVRFGGAVIHQTKSAVERGRNPIWTISTRSLFLLHGTPLEFAKHGSGLQVSFWTKRKDPLQLTTLETCFLGKAEISCSKILANCNEELLEVDVGYASGNDAQGDDATTAIIPRGTLEVRFRLATPSDQHFLASQERPLGLLKQMSTTANLASARLAPTATGEATTARAHTAPVAPLTSAAFVPPPVAELITESDEAQVAGTTFVNAISSAFVSKKYFDSTSGQEKVRVKPHPDPDRLEQTTYMTRQEMTAETLKPSQQWVSAGTGDLGKLYVEILSCTGLPNVDVGEAVGNLTDCFICAVFEDAMAQTPVIDDELSPHWLPWTQRAFCFGLMHPASMLYLGAFDFDLGLTDHESIGRVAVNISSLQRDTVYTLKYNLYKSSNVTDRTPSGCITIRLRIEYENEKEVLIAALRPRPNSHVNVRKEKSFSVVRYTCFGEYGDDKEENFDLTVVRSCINELVEYKTVLKYCLSDAVLSLIFWRGQVKVGDALLPLHSFLFFYACAVLVERPYLMPSFFLLSVAWIMLAVQTQRNQHPSPWNRCRSFLDYLEVLQTGQSSVSTRPINPHQGAKEAEAYEKAWSERLEKDQKFAATQAALQAEITTLGDVSIQTKLGGSIPLDLLERLGRYQGMIARYCRYCRFIKIIVTWEESVVSFWITACFLTAGLVSLLLPWAFILLWAGRILVWGLLGPHMMIVDSILFAGSHDEGKILEKAMENFRKESRTARLRHQEALKLKDAKSLAYGKYITLVPSYNLSRHYDRPLPGSTARLETHDKRIERAPHSIPGQQMVGVIIPRSQAAAAHHEEELADLEHQRSAFEARVRFLQENDGADVIQNRSYKSKSYEDDDLPESIIYELRSEGTDDESRRRLQPSQLSSSSGTLLVGTKVASSRDPRHPASACFEVVALKESDPQKQAVPLLSSSSSFIFFKSQSAVVETQEQANKRPRNLNDDDDARNPNETRKNIASNNSTRDVDDEDCGVEVVLGASAEDLSRDGDNNEDDDESGGDETYDGDDDNDAETSDDVSHCLATSSHVSMGIIVYCPSDKYLVL
jgi:hypothetical protein